MPTRLIIAILVAIPLSLVARTHADDSPTNEESVLAGHSYHGQAFNEGPRQSAVLIPGMAEIDFPTSTKSEPAQKFVQQGVAQLHGFWYLEAERSFRQAAKADPDLAIAYWGMAMANVNNEARARGLIDQAMKRRKRGADKREKLYIEALDRLIPKQIADETDDDKQPKSEPSEEQKLAIKEAKQKRIERYIADLEKLLHEFPGDVEAKAFLALSLWTGSREGVKLLSNYAVNALLGEVFAENPMHPAHHYRIHLWDSPRSANAIESAAMCGPSSPGIAHMWHMPGHIYSKLKRYGDAAWQQEASARVDHAHMIRNCLMPDQIHNFAHNNEWLIRNLLFVGRVNDALDLSRNLISLPRHPKYNSLEKSGSYKFGHQRLLQTLSQYESWDDLIRQANERQISIDADSMTTKELELQIDWLGWLAVAHYRSGDAKQGAKTIRTLQRRKLLLQTELLNLADRQADGATKDEGADQPDRKELTGQLERLRQSISLAAAAAATKGKDVKKLNKHADAAKLDKLIRAQWLADAGDLEGAIKLADKAVKEDQGQVRPLAVLVELLWRKGDQAKAREKFELLRTVAGAADIQSPMLARLAPVAKAADVDGDWRDPPERANDLGQRPPLDELGPFRWEPYTAPSWAAVDAGGQRVAGDEFAGRPRIMIFYLGFGCLHCVEQLHALSPKINAFRDAGIELVALSSESVEELQTGIKGFDQKLEIRLLSAGDQEAFQSFRVWDDFEAQPLHGTFLIDANDRVRWQDIGHEPFMEVNFLLQESIRLLSLR